MAICTSLHTGLFSAGGVADERGDLGDGEGVVVDDEGAFAVEVAGNADKWGLWAKEAFEFAMSEFEAAALSVGADACAADLSAGLHATPRFLERRNISKRGS